MLRYTTAGESHGKCLITSIEGLPYGTPLAPDSINAELARRQGGYGRGARMKLEKDEAEIVTGVRKGHSLGSILTLQIMNRVQNTEDLNPITRPRPGHADLAGAMKFGTRMPATSPSGRARGRPRLESRLAPSPTTSWRTSASGPWAMSSRSAESPAPPGSTIPAELVRVREESMFYTLDGSSTSASRRRWTRSSWLETPWAASSRSGSSTSPLAWAATPAGRTSSTARSRGRSCPSRR